MILYMPTVLIFMVDDFFYNTLDENNLDILSSSKKVKKKKQ